MYESEERVCCDKNYNRRSCLWKFCRATVITQQFNTLSVDILFILFWTKHADIYT